MPPRTAAGTSPREPARLGGECAGPAEVVTYFGSKNYDLRPGKHHTTVISAVQEIIERMKDDASLRSESHAIESMIVILADRATTTLPRPDLLCMVCSVCAIRI